MSRRAALSMLLLLAACEFGSISGETLSNACASAGDCAEGVCDENLCIDDSGREVEVVVEVLRPPADIEAITPLSWAYEPEAFSGSSARDYALPETREVVGRVRWGATQVPAVLRFTRRMDPSLSSIASLPVTVNTLREPITIPGAGAMDYQTKLVEGAAYDVVIAPTSDALETAGEESVPALRALSPVYLEDVVIDEGDGPFRLDVLFSNELDEGCTAEALTECSLPGNVVSTNGIVTTVEPGLQVRAVQSETGRIVSSIGETDELGRFTIRVSEQAGDYRVRVTSVPGAEPFPTISFDPADLFTNPEEGVRVIIPRLRPIEFSGRVIDEDGRPVPNTSLRLFSDSIFDDVSSQLGVDLVGSFTGTAQTSGDGRFSTRLLPGLYEVTVTPPETDERPWGVLLASALVTEVGDQPIDAQYTVPPQITFFGSVLALGAELAAGVEVKALARGNASDPSSLEQIDLARTREDTTSSEGEFSMSLDEGIYDMSLQLSSQSGFPWLVEPDVDFRRVQIARQRTYSLPAPIVARGVIRASDGTTAAGAQLRAYVLVGEGESRRAVQVAETVSEADGSYRLLISPTLAAD